MAKILVSMMMAGAVLLTGCSTVFVRKWQVGDGDEARFQSAHRKCEMMAIQGLNADRVFDLCMAEAGFTFQVAEQNHYSFPLNLILSE